MNFNTLHKSLEFFSGLPISDHDHGVNGLEFGDNGELYLQIGSNTNGGLPGQVRNLRRLRVQVYKLFSLIFDCFFLGPATAIRNTAPKGKLLFRGNLGSLLGRPAV